VSRPAGFEFCFRRVVQGAGERLDRFLAASLEGVSRKKIKQALDGGRIFVDGRVARRAGQILHGGECIEGTLLLSEPLPSPQVFVVYQDSDMLAVAKPAGLSSHPAHPGQDSALGQVCALLDGSGASPVLQHRLDRDTSGLLLFALHEESNQSLYQQFCERRVGKSYLALVEGRPPASFSADDRLKSGVRGRTVVDSRGQEANTDFVTLAYTGGAALVEAQPGTGRTHQIRVHLAIQGFPLLGDVLYGGAVFFKTAQCHLAIPRLLLHAYRLRFQHPRTGEPMMLECPPPADFLPLLSLFDDCPISS
jgi:23S rRNA pseudouridine1911/1915/1917 synthase